MLHQCDSSFSRATSADDYEPFKRLKGEEKSWHILSSRCKQLKMRPCRCKICLLWPMETWLSASTRLASSSNLSKKRHSPSNLSQDRPRYFTDVPWHRLPAKTLIAQYKILKWLYQAKVKAVTCGTLSRRSSMWCGWRIGSMIKLCRRRWEASSLRSDSMGVFME